MENVVVEETFTLASSQNNDLQGGPVGGVYVSATASGNKRYYGVLVDQPSLKEATSLWFQDQADSLELNRRIKVLKQQQEENAKVASADDDSQSRKPAGATSAEGANTSKESVEEMEITLESSMTPTNASEEKSNGSTNVDLNSPMPPSNNGGTALSPIEGQKSSELVNQESSVVSLSADTMKRPLEAPSDENAIKRVRVDATMNESIDSKPSAIATNGKAGTKEVPLVMNNDRPVQKFKYIMGGKSEHPGYRVLVATFSDIEEAACGDAALAKAIESACEEGGNYLPGDSIYYYQYEVLTTVLTSRDAKASDFDMRTSMGFHSFLHNTPLPPWFPLSNLQLKQAKVLNMLNMKRDNSGNVIWENTVPDSFGSGGNAVASLAGGTKISMQPRPRKRYQIAVVGGGIAGVACCQDMISLLKNAGVDYHITLLEARPRLGGRLWTDRSMQSSGDESFPIELGASWIHGIDDNPLAALAKEAGIDFVTASEEVQMLGKGMARVDTKMDERAGKLFDDLLDLAADDCWSAPETVVESEHDGGQDPQAAVRWYSSVFAEGGKGKENLDKSSSLREPPRIGAPEHRLSSDRSIDVEIGKAILNHKLGNFSKLSSEEHRMLMWNTKNIEYALGANIADLSMKYWDADDRHAFEGDHVLLKQGYSTVIDFMLQSIKTAAGDDFEAILNYPVGQIEYARRSTTLPYGRDRFGRASKLVELSDSCSVTSQDGNETKYFDFVVCACPLGVLKESIRTKNESSNEKLSFSPPLPFSKVDAISNVGFGLLDKVYLTFPTAFWRQDGFFKGSDQCLFGNVSGVNPHHYMFFDIGRCLVSGDNAPPILMSLISGKEAVACESMSDKDLIQEVVSTLRTIFSEDSVPEPTAFRFTRWGQDKYSRGSYTFLPPGATDQDFHLLQSPINGNGDSLLLEGSETMRLFFAGEHTTALHPSMAHGALLSGMRAAKEVVSTIQFKLDEDKDTDRIIPVALFRHKNPNTELRCNLCHKVGGQIREGSLIAFKRGARQVLVHNNCAEYSPEVEVVDSKWKSVIKAVNRGKLFNCSLCKEVGATIGCTSQNCYRIFHFSCSEDAGWRFDRDGKIFYCDLHRNQAPDYIPHCDRVSIGFYLTKNPASSLFCRLCDSSQNDDGILGQMLAFQIARRQVCVHESCIKYTSICDTSEVEDSRMGHEYKNVFRAIEVSRPCTSCSAPGATVRCSLTSCEKVFHVSCASGKGWNFEKRGKRFRCDEHRKKKSEASAEAEDVPATENGGPQKLSNEAPVEAKDVPATENGGPPKVANEAPAFAFNHNLLAQFGAVPTASAKVSTPGNLDMGGMSSMTQAASSGPQEQEEEEDGSESDDSVADSQQLEVEEAMDLPLSSVDLNGRAKRSVQMQRSSPSEPWKVSLSVVARKDKNILTLLIGNGAGIDHLSGTRMGGDAVVSINGEAIGKGKVSTLRDIASNYLKEATELTFEVVHRDEGNP
jgi:monoamine oxidase